MTAQYNSNVYDSDLLLKDGTAANLTATGNGTAISFKPALNTVIKAVVDVTVIDFTTEDETYVLTIEGSADNSTFYELARTDCKVGGTYTIGKYEMAIPGQLCNKIVADMAYVRITWTLGGTTPIIRFISYLTMV